ncbi:glutamate--tRNA ligase [Patescibacteria group bacterium]|nr:glutamate--tRNA ligase [Patescibacteria group bacterium]
MTRTRIAPSPTGEFHVGGMRTLLFNLAFAKNQNGKFVLRIEDTDRERYVEGAVDRIIQVIKDYGLDYDEGPIIGGPNPPYIQSERLEIYKKYAQELVEKGNAYYCFCTKTRLDKIREDQKLKGFSSTKYDRQCLNLTKEEVSENLKNEIPYVIRLKVPENETLTYNDLILGQVSFPSKDIDDQVLLKSDGFPTYHLGVVVDDHLMEITHILRGVEWLPSTPKHILLYRAFGWELPLIGHLPNLKEVGANKKMSKRFGDVAAREFLNKGYLPEALLNFLMFLGWNPGGEKEIYSLSEFIKDFSIEKIHKTDLVAFDRKKLDWYNSYYINKMAVEDFYLRLCKFDKSFEEFEKDKLIKILEITKDRVHTLSDVKNLITYFYTAPTNFDEIKNLSLSESKKNYDETKVIISNVIEILSKVEDWKKEKIDEVLHSLMSKLEIKPREFFMPIRIIVSGLSATPPLADVLEILGKDEVIKRLSAF